MNSILIAKLMCKVLFLEMLNGTYTSVNIIIVLEFK